MGHTQIDLPETKLPGPSVDLHTVVTMFREAAKYGPCPDAETLSRFPMLYTYGWVPLMLDKIHKSSREDRKAVLEVNAALTTLGTSLERVVEKYVPHPGDFGVSLSIAQLAPLVAISMLVPRAIASLEPATWDAPRTNWHMCAICVAGNAIEAWRLSGRTKFGRNYTSPLVRFTQAFLALAEGRTRTAESIAKVLGKGFIPRYLKQPTKPNLKM